MNKKLNTIITADVAKTYLINVAETLNNIVLPQLEGQARARANDCLRVVSRLISDSTLSPKTLELLSREVANATVDENSRALFEGDAIENANAEGVAHLDAIKAAPPAATRSFDHTTLEAYLRKHPLGGDKLRITNSRLAAGGRSKITVLVSQQGAKSLPEDFVVRQDWANSPTGKPVSLEFELLRRLHSEGVKVPQPLLLEKSAVVAGNPFMMVSRQPGAPSGDHFMSLPKSERPLMQIAEQLGRIHGMATAEFERMPGIVETNYTAAQLRTNLAAYVATIAKHDTAKSPLIARACAWLDKNADRIATAPRTLVHGDFGFHNSLVDGDELSVILDWELAHVGNPAYDLGYLRHSVTDNAVWARFMQHYKKGGGPEFEADFVDYFTLFTGIWYHQIQLHTRSFLISGAVQDMEITALCAEFAPMVLASISRTLHRVMGG